MAREIVLGNGRLCIALDKRMEIRDFTYPRVGLENHAVGHAFRIGVWVDGDFSWLDSDDWNIAMRYLPETLVSKCVATSKKFQVSLEINDAVYCFKNVYLKKIMVKNMERIKEANALAPEPLMLTDEKSLWGADIYIAVSKEVPGSEMERISGTFLSKVFEGPYKNAGKWANEMKKYVLSKGKELKNMYFFYTTCPKCAEFYGKNYVVLLAKIQ